MQTLLAMKRTIGISSINHSAQRKEEEEEASFDDNANSRFFHYFDDELTENL